MYGKLGLVEYTQLASEYKKEVDRLSSSDTEQKNPDDNSISFLEDMNLMLLRHWNLYDSLYHSTYVATHLGIWKQKGRQTLSNLLVKMGFPQKESKQFYKEMDVRYKSKLHEKLTELAPRYNIPDIIFPSFERKYGFLTTLSASDVVYSMTALLDCGSTFPQLRSGYENLLANGGEMHLMSRKEKTDFVDIGESGLVGAGVGTKTIPGTILSSIQKEIQPLQSDNRNDLIKHFYLTYDSLKTPRLLQHGILLSIHYQRLLVQQATTILEKKLVQTLGNFQLTILKNSDNEPIFSKSIPLLYRLMTFLMEAYGVFMINQEYKKRKMAFVIVVFDSESGFYVVLGKSEKSKKYILFD
jgi:cell division control protein 45